MDDLSAFFIAITSTTAPTMTEKTESPAAPHHQPNALERLTSLVTGEATPPAASGEYHTNYVLARLREERPPPGKYHMWGML